MFRICLASASPQRRALLGQIAPKFAAKHSQNRPLDPSSGPFPSPWDLEIYPLETPEKLPDYQAFPAVRTCDDPSPVLLANFASRQEAELSYAVQSIAKQKLNAALAFYRQSFTLPDLPDSSSSPELWLAADTLVATQLAVEPNASQPKDSQILGQLQDAGAHLWGSWLLLGKPKDETAARRYLQFLSARPQSVCTAIAIYANSPLVAALGTAVGNLVPKLVSAGISGSLSGQAPHYHYSEISQLQFHQLSAAEIEAYLDTAEWHAAAGAYRLQGQGAQLVAAQHGSRSNIIGLPLEFCDLLLNTIAGISVDIPDQCENAKQKSGKTEGKL